MNEDSVFKPKKRIFMALTSISAILGALMFYVVWKVTFPGLYEISRFLPIVFGFFGVLIVLAMIIAVSAFRSSSQALGIPLSLNSVCVIHGTNFLS